MKLGFVCTNYNNAGLTRAVVASLHATGRWDDLRVVVVDNRSHEEDVAALRAVAREFPGLILVPNEENVGYFRGLNVGLHRLRKEHPEVEHVVVGNNDLEFPSDFVATVERYRDVFDRWAVVAPDLVTPGGVHQNPHVRLPIGRIRKLLWDLHFLSYATAAVVRFGARISRSFTIRPENAAGSDLHLTPGPIEQGYGACYILGPVFFRHFAALCAPTFLLHEEFFLYEQLLAIGQMTYYDPRFVVRHRHHSTTGVLPNRRLWALGRDAHRMYKQYLGLTPAERIRFLAAWGGAPVTQR